MHKEIILTVTANFPHLFHKESKYDNRKNIIAAIHAGWKGAFKGIINNVINFMIKKGCKRKSIFAAVGPCIGRHSYIVKDDFKKRGSGPK